MMESLTISYIPAVSAVTNKLSRSFLGIKFFFRKGGSYEMS